MSRNKYPEITEQRILDAATKLFLNNGWEETTIQNIVDELGDVTRGAFYHHFKSKDDILDAVTTRMFMQENQIEEVKVENGMNGLEKLKKLLLLSMTYHDQLQFAKTAQSVLRSPIFVGKQFKDCVNSLAPSIQGFFQEGLEDGSIKLNYPKQTAETFMILINQWLSPVLFPVTKEEYMLKFEHFKQLYDSIGLPIMDDKFRQAFEAYHNFISN